MHCFPSCALRASLLILHNAELVIEILVPLIAIWMTTILVCEVSRACMGLTYAPQQEAPFAILEKCQMHMIQKSLVSILFCACFGRTTSFRAVTQKRAADVYCKPS